MGEAIPPITHEDLDSAFKNKQFFLVFQPKVSISRLLATGAEAFIRWQHPSHGLLMPGLFLGFIEQEGRLRELTLFVLREALRQCLAWHREGLHWTVAVNVGASDLVDGSLATSVNLLLEEFDLPADALTLDVPEAELAKNAAQVLPTLLDLRARGCGVALDSGANPFLLEDIKGLPLTELKIAGSAIIQFVQSTQHAGHGRIAARLKLAKEYRIPASAVGVEDEATLWALQRAGFDNAQGLYICRPLRGQELKRWDAIWRDAAHNLAASKKRPLIAIDMTGEAPQKIIPQRQPQAADEVVTSKLVRGPDARPLVLEISAHKAQQAAASAPAVTDEVPTLCADAPSLDDIGASPSKATLELPIRQVPRAVRGSSGADTPPKGSEEQLPETLPLIARKVPGLDKPIAMSVQNPGRQGFSLFRKR
jgi:EAL domain-containing protein (putative c-di-GMP-specific phosphodiesterase class I)